MAVIKLKCTDGTSGLAVGRYTRTGYRSAEIRSTEYGPGVTNFMIPLFTVPPDRLMTEVGFQFECSSDNVIRLLLKDARRLVT